MIITRKPLFGVKKVIPLKDFYEKKDTVLFTRKSGGFGDILMMRMMFEDIKKQYPDLTIHWAIPGGYLDLGDHPYVDKILDIFETDPESYPYYLDLSDACIKYEWKHAKECDKHRSDIWAEHCGVELTNHNMFLTIKEESRVKAKERLAQKKEFPDAKTILLAPYSAQSVKNLTIDQTVFIYNYLKNKGINCIVLHNRGEMELFQKKIPFILDLSLSETMAAIDMTEAVIGTDTGTIHASAGLNKPTLAVFSYVDGNVYCKYYKDCIILQKTGKGTDLPDCPCWNYPQCHVTKNATKPCVTNINNSDLEKKIDELLLRI